MAFIGVDPGASGGLAIIWNNGKAEAFKMPSTERDIHDLVTSVCSPHDFAIIERVSSMPKQGVRAVWTFSGNYHGLRMALIAAGVPFEAVPPSVWQKAMGCLTKGQKNVTKRRAQELFPQIKVTHALADALLIAEFCRRTRRA